LFVALDLDVQLIPSGLVITRFPVPVVETATNRPNSADQQTPCQKLSTALDLDVQLIPSGLVITRFPVPLPDTATNLSRSCDQHTESQMLSAALLRVTHGCRAQ
jgi:phage gp36-like protein